ncbi:2-succinyl-5-enolpyruvyl-6-hydroxy-3-cyclohexene-1-carboxylic-acid synthase [Paenisporosarcina cavernae]|uniref:2-succinyl-5-enolpyruvyl-6-hydroxy-3-cyclohexene-1-carboxylate synthase n=1 Tax=Paenisporosarcina cavernae TaxID=2320858 RepID=A0A385YTQ4_9BACL|nr:2-succinyl-5-enolpyruvyl-6-hydroxy-3-cyclohexene-1-carboxylic-acid synthase [Paenisporosarcina cavernae]AYC29924.1 2-succinyl-5-enolpyruvyl-6-hydroxy-3-cyclohexene-1-carboxylic-acid synthase [Paenisporosarcina cavernae]
MESKQVLTNYVATFVQSLIAQGVEHVVISPGSRSTPLAYAFKHVKTIKTYLHIDERSAGFMALGMAKSLQKPVALLCTSGTAAANYFPAIVEAKNARIPLIVITADRPHELREVGAAQAIDQVNLYGNQVKWSVDFPLPDAQASTNQFLTQHITRMVQTAVTAPRGPVHMNVPFREPLLINLEEKFAPVSSVQSFPTRNSVLPETLKEVQTIMKDSTRGIVVVGELPMNTNSEELLKALEKIGWPVLADPLSNLRKFTHECVIDQYDSLMKSSSFTSRITPDVIIRIGAQPVSKPLALFLSKVKAQAVITIDESAQYRDPFMWTTHHIVAAPEDVLSKLIYTGKHATLPIWIQANQLATSKVMEYASQHEDEGTFAKMVVDLLPEDSILFASSSMPIRDVDTYFLKTSKNIDVLSNRGANGIDGVISTAIGVQLATEKEVTVLIGDLACLHDANALLASKYNNVKLTVVVMNNNGGGIFSYLPQKAEDTHFEDLFGTPANIDFLPFAKLFGADYQKVSDKDALRQSFLKETEFSIRFIEVITNREENLLSHRKLWSQIDEAIQHV